MGVHHQVTVDGVERLHDFRKGKGFLNLFTERLAPAFIGWKQVGHVDDDLAVRRSCPAAFNAAIEAEPFVQLNTISPNAAVSANVPECPPVPAWLAQASALGLFAVRDPIMTSWPSAMSLEAIAWPTMPVPSTPIFIVTSVSRPEPQRGDARRTRVGSTLRRIRNSRSSSGRYVFMRRATASVSSSPLRPSLPAPERTASRNASM